MKGLYRRTADKRRSRTDTPKDRAAFAKVRRAERQYATQLRKVARHVGEIIKSHKPDTSDGLAEIRAILAKYSEVIEPWAKTAAARMIADVGRRDDKAWEANSKAMGRALREEIANAPTGQFLRAKLAENVKLIKSLPTEAAQRVHNLTIEGLNNATRASEIAKEIARSGQVTIGRANLIARTEVARTASGLVEARARHVGSDGYIWRSSGDNDVRNKDGNPVGSHRLLNGKFISWDDPPVASTNGDRYHAGQGPNCRCYPEPVIPDDF
jgi:SPP1 gp7 family putative phage head morphogenesis protein